MEKRSIGSFIAVLRKAKGLTQRQLAEQLNVSDKAVSRWERDEALPDLTLIPVLADIFGVSSDELLRGQRNVNDTLPSQAEEKSRKQLKYLLDKAKTDYQIKTLICIMVALLGLMVAAIANLGFLRAVIGFWAGCVFFLVATVLQAVFAIQVKGKLNAGEFDEEAICDCKKYLLRHTMHSYGWILVLFLLCLPLGLLQSHAYVGLDVGSWLQQGLGMGIFGGAVYVVACLFVYHKKTGQAGRAKLLRKTLLVLLAVFLCTALLQATAARILEGNRHWFGIGTKYDSFEAFQAFIEQPQHSTATVLEEQALNGEPHLRVYEISTDGVDSYKQDFYANRCRWQGEIRYYFHLNESITYISFGSDAIYTYTASQSLGLRNAIDTVLALMLLLYPIELAAAVLVYRKKAKALPTA